MTEQKLPAVQLPPEVVLRDTAEGESCVLADDLPKIIAQAKLRYLEEITPKFEEVEHEARQEERERYQSVVAAARFLLDHNAGHPSRPSAQRSCWNALARALDALDHQQEGSGDV